MTAIQNIVNSLSDLTVHAAVSSMVGYCAARAFTPLLLDPVTAAVVTGVASIVSRITSPIFNAIFARPTADKATRFLGNVLNLTTSLALPVAIANAIGYPITIPAFVCLTAVTVGTYVLVSLGINQLTASTVPVAPVTIL